MVDSEAYNGSDALDVHRLPGEIFVANIRREQTEVFLRLYKAKSEYQSLRALDVAFTMSGELLPGFVTVLAIPAVSQIDRATR